MCGVCGACDTCVWYMCVVYVCGVYVVRVVCVCLSLFKHHCLYIQYTIIKYFKLFLLCINLPPTIFIACSAHASLFCGLCFPMKPSSTCVYACMWKCMCYWCVCVYPMQRQILLMALLFTGSNCMERTALMSK